MPGFVLLARDRADGDDAVRLGYTVTKKVGNAVVRNRMKRRMRELARALVPEFGRDGHDYVLIGREGGIERDFAALKGELAKALRKVTDSKPVRAEPVEALSFSSTKEQEAPSTSSGRTGKNSSRAR